MDATEPTPGETPAHPADRKIRASAGILRSFIPALATLTVAALLLFTISFTLVDWQWVAFLSGVLVAALLALATRASRAEWLLRERGLQISALKQSLDQMQQSKSNAEQAYASGEEKMRLIFDAMPIALFFVDTAQQLRYHNRAFAEWLGTDASRINGKSLRNVLGARAYLGQDEALTKAISGQRIDFQHEFIFDSGETRRATAAYLPYFDKEGGMMGFFGLLSPQSGLAKTANSAEGDPFHDGTIEPATENAFQRGDASQRYLEDISRQLTGWNSPEARLRQALEQDDFRLYGQPIVAVANTAEPGPFYEILLRLQEEEDKLMPPGAFIPVAQRYGMMPEIDRWVVRTLVNWMVENTRVQPTWSPTMYNINLFGPTLGDDKFAAYVQHQVQARRAPAKALCFEISESEALNRPQDAARLARSMKQIGCRIAIGGFSGSQPSFDLLKQLQPDLIKIDGSLVRNMDNNRVNHAKIKALARVCKRIGVRTVGEFVESEKIFKQLMEMEIDYAQGFGIGAPRPLAEFMIRP